MNSDVKLAAAQLKKGKFIVLYDGDEREGEADLIFHASFATPAKIARLRKDAGGLICLATNIQIANKIGLPFFVDLLNNKKLKAIRVNKTAYGDKPAFSLPINHRDVYTGIPDNDRALTIKQFANLIRKAHSAMRNAFIQNFYAPGHVFLLIGRGLKNRRGHTELSLELANLAKLPAAMVLCEMLGNGKALSKKKAQAYAKQYGFVFLEGKDIFEVKK